MTDTTLFKRAFARGLCTDLVRTGAIAFPTKEAADHAADFVADNSGMPDPYSQPEAITLKVAGDLCVMLKQASEVLCKEAGGYSPELSKTAAASDPAAAAAQDCFSLMQKVAYETETPNTAEAAAQHNEAAELDKRHRPEGYANSGVGNYEDKGTGAVGVEKDQPRGDAVQGSNSATENSKTALDRAISALAKAASAPYTSAPNTPANAAQHNEAAALDQHNRPAGYANVGVNKSKFEVPAGARIGVEQAHTRHMHPAGTNTVVQASKTASEILFDKTASRVLPFLVEGMSDKEKVAHIQALAPLSKTAQAKYLHQMYGAYGVEKAAAAAAAQEYLKVAEDDGDDDMAVAHAMEQAASSLNGAAEHEEEEAKEESGEDSAKEAAFTGLQAAVSRLRA